MTKRILTEKVGLKFKLVLYENRGFHGGDKWTATESKPNADFDNDEVAAFKLSGDPGVRVEFFNSPKRSKKKTWAEATLTPELTQISVPNMRDNEDGYVHHKKPGDDNIDGKVSKISVYH